MVEELKKETFDRNMNSTFRVADKETPTCVEIQLVETHRGQVTEACEQFSVIFRGPAEPLLPQKVYGVEHDRLGTFDLFLVPVGADETGVSYEAVFNRLKT